MSRQQEPHQQAALTGAQDDAYLRRRADELSAQVQQHLAKLKRPTTAVVSPIGSHQGGSTYRFRRYRLVLDHEPDAEPAMYAVQCCVCEEQSSFSEDPEVGSGWAVDHLAATCEHFTYRLLRTTPFRAEPGAWL